MIGRFWRTIKYLKPTQVAYQLLYRFGKHVKSNPANLPLSGPTTRLETPRDFIPTMNLFIAPAKFTFLNTLHDFDSEIDWNIMQHGKLWCYNLNYFNFLMQIDLDVKRGLHLIQAFQESYETNTVGKEPYPTSLRLMNWIKFLWMHEIVDEGVNQFLYREMQNLAAELELHLLGNHLLENAFALLFASLYFGDGRTLPTAQKLLISELDEQILDDGAHFELSPMYHQLLCERILDCIHILKKIEPQGHNELLTYLNGKASKMLGWLRNVTFVNGSIPHVNDSTDGISATSRQLFEYADRLDVSISSLALSSSGYRMFNLGKYELFVDAANVEASYQPGHTHADTLNFLLHYDEKPYVVDRGISTYERNQHRALERSTPAHNTVSLENLDSTEVWAAFRVGRRAKVTDIMETDAFISACHDGYRRFGILHQRKWTHSSDSLVIADRILGRTLPADESVVSHIHFHPTITIKVLDDQSVSTSFGRITFSKGANVQSKTYQFAEGFNLRRPAQKLEISFSQELITKFELRI